MLALALAALLASPQLQVVAPPELEAQAAQVRHLDLEGLSGALDLLGLDDFGAPIRVVIAHPGSRWDHGLPDWVSGWADGQAGVVVLFPEQGVIAMGDMFTHGEGLVQLVDYAGGGSARAWTKTLDGALGLDFETVVPGHGVVTDRAAVETFRETTVRLVETVRAMIRAKRTAGDIEVHSFAGKTDPQIARELLSGAGLAGAAIDAGSRASTARYSSIAADRCPVAARAAARDRRASP